MVATRAFGPDDVITDVDGVLVGNFVPSDDRYLLWLENEDYLDITDQTRWINHSCDPNVWIDGGIRGGQPWAKVIALRPVSAGEELTFDYAYDRESMQPCACGAATCKGWIVDSEELAQIQARGALQAAAG
ncbi:MAG TPA: SET domain-containing protein-lysine N-methyltransferase [Kofleriaceae bacterium]